MHTLMPSAPPVAKSRVKHMQEAIAGMSDSVREESIVSKNSRKKLNGALTALLDGRLGNMEAKFVKDGKIEIQILLSDASPETLAQLDKIGFELLHHPKKKKLVIGRISIERLEELAQVKAVRYITPFRA